MSTPWQTLNNSNLPNPLAPEAWLPFEGNSHTIFTAVAIGVLSVWIWDILTCLPDEFKLLLESKLSLPTICYCVARLSPLPLLAIHTTLLTQEVQNCKIWAFFQNIFYSMDQISAGLIFLLRVRAVYGDVPRFKLAISAAWGAYAVTHLLPFFFVRIFQVEPIRRCMWFIETPYPSILGFVQMAYDLSICVAVTYKICHDMVKDDKHSIFWWPCGMRKSHFSKLRTRLLVDNQLYFVVAFVLKTIEITVYFAGNTLFLLIFGLLDTFFISIIACKIHRKFRLGKPGLLDPSYEMTTIGDLSIISPTSRPIEVRVREVPKERRSAN